MPVSKKGLAYYTKEQYEAAKYNGNALEYAQSQGYELVRQGAYYKLKDHDSMVFTPSGRWFWNSRGVHGGAMEFMMYYEGKTITEAVLTLAGEQVRFDTLPRARDKILSPLSPPTANDTVRYEFRLPEKAKDFKRLFAYLCGERGLEKSVVQEMIRQNRLFQSAAKLPSGKLVNNATFVYLDAQGNPVGAFQRGMYDREGIAPYKRDTPGSDKRWGWMLASPFHPATEIRAFEGAIDAASDASISAMKARDAWRQEAVDRLSLEGLSIQPLLNYLQTHPEVQKVTLMLDADEAGRKAAAGIASQLVSLGYQVEDRVPPFGKDWNQVLVHTRSMAAELETVPQPEAPDV